MKMKNLTNLAIILIVIIGIIVIANQLQNKKPSEQSLVFLPQFSEATCTKMLIIEGKDSSVLVKNAAQWMVESHGVPSAALTSPVIAQPATAVQSLGAAEQYPADSAAVQTALDKLKSLKKDDLISQNAGKQAELEVDTAKGIFVQTWNDKGASTVAIYIGKAGANWDTHFIREKGSNDVYLAVGSVRMSFFGEKKRWKDKSVIKFDKSFVKDLKIVRKDSGSVEMVKTAPTPTDTSIKEGWQITAPEKFKAKKDKVEDVLNTFSKLAAADFESETTLSADSMGFTKPQLVISATLQSGEVKTMIAGKKKGTSGQYWVKNPENTKAIFLVAEYNINSMNVGINSLKDVPGPASGEPPKPIAPATTKKEAKIKAKKK